MRVESEPAKPANSHFSPAGKETTDGRNVSGAERFAASAFGADPFVSGQKPNRFGEPNEPLDSAHQALCKVKSQTKHETIINKN